MIATIYSRKDTQDLLKKLRRSGFIVDRLTDRDGVYRYGYQIRHNDSIIFKATKGNRATHYLVAYDPDFFEWKNRTGFIYGKNPN